MLICSLNHVKRENFYERKWKNIELKIRSNWEQTMKIMKDLPRWLWRIFREFHEKLNQLFGEKSFFKYLMSLFTSIKCFPTVSIQDERAHYPWIFLLHKWLRFSIISKFTSSISTAMHLTVALMWESGNLNWDCIKPLDWAKKLN